MEVTLKDKCKICGVILNSPKDPTTRDCGGDCLRCMATVADDPDCLQEMYTITEDVRYLNKADDKT